MKWNESNKDKHQTYKNKIFMNFTNKEILKCLFYCLFQINIKTNVNEVNIKEVGYTDRNSCYMKKIIICKKCEIRVSKSFYCTKKVSITFFNLVWCQQKPRSKTLVFFRNVWNARHLYLYVLQFSAVKEIIEF